MGKAAAAWKSEGSPGARAVLAVIMTVRRLGLATEHTPVPPLMYSTDKLLCGQKHTHTQSHKKNCYSHWCETILSNYTNATVALLHEQRTIQRDGFTTKHNQGLNTSQTRTHTHTPHSLF